MKLVHETHHVVLYPALHEFVIDDVRHREACHDDRLSGRWNSKNRPLMNAASCRKRTDSVSFGDLIFDRNFEMRECGAKNRHDLPNALNSRGSARRCVVIDVGRIQKDFEKIQSSVVEDFFDEVSINEFVSFKAHAAISAIALPSGP
jgi:hypothetical protein